MCTIGLALACAGCASGSAVNTAAAVTTTTQTTVATTTMTVAATTITAAPIPSLCQPMSASWAAYFGRTVEQGPLADAVTVYAGNFIVSGETDSATYYAGWPNRADASSAAPTSQPYVWAMLSGPGPLNEVPLAVSLSAVQANANYNDQFLNANGPTAGFVWPAANQFPPLDSSPFFQLAATCADQAASANE